MTDPLRELAAANDVAVEYWNWRGEHVHVRRETLVAVLGALGIDASTSQACRAALADRELAPWRRVLPLYVVMRDDERRTVEVHVTDGGPVEVRLTLEDGTHHSHLRQVDNHEAPREVDGRWVGVAAFELPAGLPLGYHRLHASTGASGHETAVIVTPSWLGLPERLGDRPVWGLATQLYSVRSRDSWGVGDLTDLADLAIWAGTEHEAGFVLVNPLHAAQPVAPLEPSPYLPTTRRFANPLYLRIDRIAEYATADAATRAEIARLAAGLDPSAELIDRNATWGAKRRALELIHRLPRSIARDLSLQAFRRREGVALDDFAAWCALSEQHGPSWLDWPGEYRDPRSAAVASFVAAHPDQVAFHRWLQWLLDDQLSAAQSTARGAGMSLGIVHDLAVGVSRTGADSWSRQDELAHGISVGAPPDAYAQTGQLWNQPPCRPDRLAETGYAPFRELIASALRHSGGLRVDHIIGLFRLWWIPDGMAATNGTYVRYDHDAFIGILALEAARAGAVIIGEDLGTVEPWVRDYLRSRGLLGTSVLWFEFDYDGGGGPLAPERWREYCLAAVTTHDLPPTAGYLAGDHVRLRSDLGLLTRTLDEELDADSVEQTAWLDAMRSRGLLADNADRDETVVALHRALGFAPSRLRCLSLTDAVGDRRTQNQPGANVGYPNWRVPLTGPDGHPLLLDDVLTSERAALLAEVMRAGLSR